MQPRQPDRFTLDLAGRRHGKLDVFSNLGLDDPALVRVDPLAEINPLGLCADCVRPAALPCPDGFGRCRIHARMLAKAITVRENSRRHCSTPAQRKARAKRRAARKTAKR